VNNIRCILGGLVAAVSLCGCSSDGQSPGAANSGGSAGAIFGSGGTGGGAGGAVSAGGMGAGGFSAGGAGAGGLGGTVGSGGVGGGNSCAVKEPPDAGWAVPTNDRPDLFSGPCALSLAGLYSDTAHGVLAPDVQHYVPQYALWSDSAAKERWLKLPPGTKIDTTNMDDWVFPIGTKAFKEFTRDGKRVETRMVWKAAADQWQMVAYIWNPQQTEAYAAPNGQTDASGTPHDVPDATMCPTCHNGRTDRLLGVSALQLSRSAASPNDVTLDSLKAANLLTNVPASALKLPGDQATQDALGYLHANCGQCHNEKSPVPTPDRKITVYFWENADELGTLEGTAAYKSLVTTKNSPLWINAVSDRMGVRGNSTQMPPLATQDVDTDGMAKVKVLMDLLRTKVPTLPTPAAHGNCVLTDALKQTLVDSCGTSFCHGSMNDAQGQLRISALQTDQELTNLLVATPAAPNLACSKVGISRVEPGSPERSLLWLKLSPGPPCGTVMPPTGTVAQDKLDAIKAWITSCTPTP
jgi:hypothetical protein